MLHDFNRDIGNLGRDWKYSSESNSHVERCISTIHDFIETGKVLSWYDGVGSLFSSVGMYVKYKWDEQKNIYFLDVPKEKIPRLVFDLNAHIDGMEKLNKSDPDRAVYTKDVISYWKEQVKYLKSKL